MVYIRRKNLQAKQPFRKKHEDSGTEWLLRSNPGLSRVQVPMFSSRHFFFCKCFLVVRTWDTSIWLTWCISALNMQSFFLYFRPFSAAWLYFSVQSHYMLMNSDLHTSSQAKRLFAFELAMQCALFVSFPSCQQKVHWIRNGVTHWQIACLQTRSLGFEIGPSPKKCSKNWNVWIFCVFM